MELHFLEFNKWRPIHASVGSVSGVLAWVACSREFRASMDDMGGAPT